MENVYKSDLQQGILTHDCVSFDLMNTLVMRRVPMAADVFSMIEQRISPQFSFPFCEIRLRAEKELQAEGTPVTFEAIYLRLRQLTGIDEAGMLFLMQEEQKAESEVLVIRRDMIDLLRLAHDSGKTVTVLADSYMSGERVRALLQALGVTDYAQLLSSADIGLTRATGLYGYYRDTVGADKRLLHIGDNPVKDGEMAQAYGIDVLLIPRALDLYRRDNPGMTIPQDQSSRRILGEKIARQYNSPFA